MISPWRPSMMTTSPTLIFCINPAMPETCQATDRARHNRGVTFGAAQHGGDARNVFGIHQGRIGRRDFFGDDHTAFGRIGKRIIVLLQQMAGQSRTDLAHIIRAGRKIFIIHARKTGFNRGNLLLDRRFGIDPIPRG